MINSFHNLKIIFDLSVLLKDRFPVIFSVQNIYKGIKNFLGNNEIFIQENFKFSYVSH